MPARTRKPLWRNRAIAARMLSPNLDPRIQATVRMQSSAQEQEFIVGKVTMLNLEAGAASEIASVLKHPLTC